MRVVIGMLLAANLVVAVIAFKPFGGSAEDLRRQTEMLPAQLSRAEATLATSKKLVQKVQAARTEGDQVMTKYRPDRRTIPSPLLDRSNKLSAGPRVNADLPIYHA